jgi:hypothetical protein
MKTMNFDLATTTLIHVVIGVVGVWLGWAAVRGFRAAR